MSTAGRPETDDVVPVPVARFAAKVEIEKEARLQSPPMPTARPPEIDSGKRQPEKREVASTGDGARGDTAFALRAEPAVPIDDVVKPVMQFRFRAEDHPGIWIHVGCAFTTEADGDGCGRFVAQDHARGLGFGILRARLGYQFIQAYALRIGIRRHDLAHVPFGVFDQLALVHQDDAGRRHDEDDACRR